MSCAPDNIQVPSLFHLKAISASGSRSEKRLTRVPWAGIIYGSGITIGTGIIIRKKKFVGNYNLTEIFLNEGIIMASG